jgi:predicted acylesterase/phospholipase RssA
MSEGYIQEAEINTTPDDKEHPKDINIGDAAAGIGVLEILEHEGLEIPYIGGASGGSIFSAVYYLEGDARATKDKLYEKLSNNIDIKLNPFGEPMSGEILGNIITDILDGRDWEDGKLKGACFGAAYEDTKKPLLITRDTGLSLTEAVLASISLKMVKPTVKVDGRIVAHGGDPDYIRGLREVGADFVIEVAPNLEEGAIGKVARAANVISSAVILKGDYLATKKAVSEGIRERADFAIRPNPSIRPFISPFKFSERNVHLMISKGKELAEQTIPKLKEVLSNK